MDGHLATRVRHRELRPGDHPEHPGHQRPASTASATGWSSAPDGITVDLDGHTLDGTGLGVGILNNGFDRVTITNGSVQEFDFGVQLGAGTANNIVSFLALQPQPGGRHPACPTPTTARMGNTIRANDIVGNNTGILIARHAGHAWFVDNTDRHHGDDGIRLETSSGNRVEGNR